MFFNIAIHPIRSCRNATSISILSSLDDVSVSAVAFASYTSELGNLWALLLIQQPDLTHTSIFTCAGFTRSIHSFIHEKPNHPLGYLTMTPPMLQKAPFSWDGLTETTCHSPNISCFLYIHTNSFLSFTALQRQTVCKTVCLQSRLLRKRRTILFKPTSAPALCVFFCRVFPLLAEPRWRETARSAAAPRPAAVAVGHKSAGESGRLLCSALQRPLFYGYCGRGYRRASGNRLDNGAAYSRW